MSAVVETTINVSKTEENIGKLQGQVNQMRMEMRTGIRAIMSDAELLPDDEFWPLVAELNRWIEMRKNHAIAAEQFIHTLTYNHVRGLETDRTTAMRFVKTYNEKSHALYKPLYDVIKNCGDDGYGDILDSFPLFGQERYELALKGEIVGTQKEQDQGENYMVMKMENAMLDLYASSCRSEYDPESECEPF